MNSKKAAGIESQSRTELFSHCTVVEELENLPLLILPKMVLFPRNTLPLPTLEGLKRSDLATAQRGLLRVGVLTFLDEDETPGTEQMISPFGTEALITGMVKPANGGIGAILKGMRRLVVRDIEKKPHGYTGHAYVVVDKSIAKKNSHYLASVRAIKSLVIKIIKLNPTIPQDLVALLYTCDDPALLCDILAPQLSLTPKEKLGILSNLDLRDRVKQVLKFLSREVDLLQISFRIQEEVKDDMQEGMRRAFLKEQMLAIKRELGENEPEVDELEEFRNTFNRLNLSKPARDAAMREVDRLEVMPPGSPEYVVAWNYLGWLKDIPWPETAAAKDEAAKAKEPEVPNASLARSKRLLNSHHFGLEKVKDRILEYIAVMLHKKSIPNGQVLFLLGPPGVGKTTIARSIAESLGRPFVRISLGGVKDEAEVRGHRKTYIGSMPGKLIQAMKEAKAINPVILLDEIDKIGAQGRGDLGPALLEVLDVEQNSNFQDHYLGFPYDLSQVLFIATGNSMRGMDAPLLDRLEIVEFSGYSEREKLQIAQKYILPALCKELNLKSTQFKIADDVLKLIVHHYTRESGVRQLKRALQTIGRKIVRRLVEQKTSDPQVKAEHLIRFLGNPLHLLEPENLELPSGVAIGLAYTSHGGELLYIETRCSKTGEGKGGRLQVTGNIGKVMQESAHTVYSYVISRAAELGLDLKELEASNIHCHVPDGGTPKDGPSAGVALLCAFVSLFSGKAIPGSLTMTGEITLRGQVLPIGGLKEKMLAAHREGKTEIMFPAVNWPDLSDIPVEVLNAMKLYPVSTMAEALQVAGLAPLGKPFTARKPTKFRRLDSAKDHPFKRTTMPVVNLQ